MLVILQSWSKILIPNFLENSERFMNLVNLIVELLWPDLHKDLSSLRMKYMYYKLKIKINTN